MNSRVGVVLGVGLMALIIRAASSGKVPRAWAALWGAPPASGSGGLSQGGQGQSPGSGSPLPSTGGAAPDSALFGLTPGLSPYDAITQGYSPTVTAADTAGLMAAGGTAAVHDWDYATAEGTAAVLPGNASTTYTLVREDPVTSPWAGLEAFQTGNHGVMEFVHLEAEVPPGIYHGGDTVGRTGQPNDPTYGYGQQLAVIVDRLGAAFLGVTA